MTNDWLDEEAHYHEALEGDPDKGAADDVRYRLTPLGALALDEGGAFVGFGPCAPAPTPAATRLERALRVRKRRMTQLFG